MDPYTLQSDLHSRQITLSKCPSVRHNIETFFVFLALKIIITKEILFMYFGQHNRIITTIQLNVCIYMSSLGVRGGEG